LHLKILICAACVPAAALIVAIAVPVLAQTTASLAARCDQLIDYFDRYGPGRGEHSDGARNMTRTAAKIDCLEGRYEKGIAAMEALLRRKKLTVPPPSRG